MRIRVLAHGAAVLAFLVSVAVAQTTWVVDTQQRAGFHFAELQPAFDDARVGPGDTLYVRDGAYVGATLRKGVAVRGESGSRLLGLLTIENVPSGAHASLAGLEVNRGLRVQQCAGQVLLDQVDSGAFAREWRVAGCPSVQIVDCVLHSSRLEVTDSLVGVHRSRLTGVSAGSEAWWAVHAVRSALAVSDSFVAGGVYWVNAIGNRSVPAFYLVDSNVGICGASQIGDPLFVPGQRSGGSGSSRVVSDASVRFAPEYTHWGIAVDRRSIPSLHLDPLRIGNVAPGSVASSAAGPDAVALSVARPVVFVPSLNGALALDPVAHVVLLAGVLQANVPQAWSLTVPTAWQLRGQVFAVQAVQASVAPVLSNPVVRVVF